MTQAEDVLNYIKENGSVSSFDGFTELGIVSLPKRICELKKRGYKFKIKKMLKFNKKNKLVSYNRYSLDEEQCRIMGVM